MASFLSWLNLLHKDQRGAGPGLYFAAIGVVMIVGYSTGNFTSSEPVADLFAKDDQPAVRQIAEQPSDSLTEQAPTDDDHTPE